MMTLPPPEVTRRERWALRLRAPVVSQGKNALRDADWGWWFAWCASDDPMHAIEAVKKHLVRRNGINQRHKRRKG